MANKLQFALIFCSIHLGFVGNSAATGPILFANITIDTIYCDDPAPDSFHVASSGTNFVNLAWQPAWSGAMHTLTELKKNGNTGSWEPIDTFLNVPGSSFTVSNLLYGSTYRFIIATNCANGGTSERTSTVDHINLILDLVLAGRTPNNPTPLEDCPLVSYLPATNNWVGFSIEAPHSSGGFNIRYFEFAEGSFLGEPIPTIKRDDHTWLVASNSDFQPKYPKKPDPLVVRIEGSYIFKIYHVKGFPIPHYVGTLEVVEFDPANKMVKICKRPEVFWDQNYLFTMLTATSASGFSHPLNEGRDEVQGIEPSTSNNKAIVQTPFNDLLTISFPEPYLEQGDAFIQLLNTSGQVLISSHFDMAPGQVSLHVESLSTGLYILRIEIDGKTQILKVAKAE